MRSDRGLRIENRSEQIIRKRKIERYADLASIWRVAVHEACPDQRAPTSVGDWRRSASPFGRRREYYSLAMFYPLIPNLSLRAHNGSLATI